MRDAELWVAVALACLAAVLLWRMHRLIADLEEDRSAENLRIDRLKDQLNAQRSLLQRQNSQLYDMDQRIQQMHTYMGRDY